MARVNIGYEVKRLYKAGLQAALKEMSEKFADAKVTTVYPHNQKDPFNVPQAVVVGASYEMSKTSLHNNFYSDIIEDGIVVGKKFATIIPYSTNIICLANNEAVAEDLANEIVDLLAFSASGLFNNNLNLNIDRVQLGPGSMNRDRPDNAFAYTVGVQGSLHWQGEIRENDFEGIMKLVLKIIKE